MLKSFGLIDNIWFDSQVKFPFRISRGEYVFRKLYEGRFGHQKQLREWELSHNHSTGRYEYIVEITKEHQYKDHYSSLVSFGRIVSLLRLIMYNRVYFAHIVSFEDMTVVLSGSTDDPRPSSFFEKNEEISKKNIRILDVILQNIRVILAGKNARVLRAFHFWDSSSCSGTFERKVVELFIALESLFTTGSEEVTFRLASRMAWFLDNKDTEKRLALYKKIKKGYSIRSNIVHGKAFVEDKDLLTVQELHALTRDILLRIFTDKKLLSVFSEDDIEPYFNELVMGKV